jgi:hypothetical protein
MNNRNHFWLKLAPLTETLSSAASAERPQRRLRCSCGFTLLELVVVIGIIMALAGILTLTLPNMLNEANEASLVTNLKLCDDMIQSWQATHHGEYPTGWDSLITGATLYAYLPKVGTGSPVGGCVGTLTLTAAHVERLRRAGITSVCDMTYAGTPMGAVSASYMAASTTARTLATGGTIAKVDVATTLAQTSHVQMEFDSTHDYAIFGVGRGTQLVGVGGYIKDQPIVVHPEGCTSPKSVYCVPCAIFDLGVTPSGGGTVSSRDSTMARYMGTVAVGENGFLHSEDTIAKR